MKYLQTYEKFGIKDDLLKQVDAIYDKILSNPIQNFRFKLYLLR